MDKHTKRLLMSRIMVNMYAERIYRVTDPRRAYVHLRQQRALARRLLHGIRK